MSDVPRQYCSFVVGDGVYGIDALRVQEIVKARATTPVPLARTAVTGLMNLRGQIVTVLDVRERLGVAPRELGSTAIVVVQTADGPIGLMVDEIGDVVDVTGDQMEPPPDTLRGPARAFIVGACKLPGRLLLALDLDKVVAL
jgi:purine-binding chemotaxis protein CheW